MYIDANTIVTAASVITALTVIFGVIFSAYRWYLRQNQQDTEIKKMKAEQAHEMEKMKSEQCLLTYGILACLKGLKEQGCNGPVTEAIDKIEKHINQAAHEQED